MSPTSYQTAPPRIMRIDYYYVFEFNVKAFLDEAVSRFLNGFFYTENPQVGQFWAPSHQLF
jgi:hypothetical protein